jgi:hypothetical protein
MILFFYGEHEAPEEVERDLRSDPELARRYDALRRDLLPLDELNAPEPRPGLESRMWARVAPSLAKPRRRAFLLPSGWLGWVALATAVGVVAAGGFLAGRTMRPRPTETETVASLEALPPDARGRVLAAALSDHLSSSERLLLEVANGAPSLDEERRWAETLLSENRLYRRAAERAGQRRVAAVLAEIEPLLTQLANAPDSFDLRTSQKQIASKDLLFKVRITRNNLKETS